MIAFAYPSRPAGVGLWFCVIALLHLLILGKNTIPYKLAHLVTFERLKWKYCFATNVLIVYEIRLIAIREVSPPFGKERASTAVELEISFPANKQRRQLWNSESL